MLLVRHGQSEFNAAFNETRVDPGIIDPPLTQLGRAQAAAAADQLIAAGVRRLISSPYVRTLETAQIIAGRIGVSITIDACVRERAGFMCDIGTRPAALGRRFAGLNFDHLDDPWWHDPLAAGEEPEAAIIARSVRFRAAAGAMADFHHVAVVTHWGFIKALTGRPALNGEVMRLDPGA